MWFAVRFSMVWMGADIGLAVTGFWNYFSGINTNANLALGVVGIIFALSGWSIISDTFRKLQRRRSLRRETTESGAVVYVWIDLDGQEARSNHDPTPTWDAEDGDGDGDGDGGGD